MVELVAVLVEEGVVEEVVVVEDVGVRVLDDCVTGLLVLVVELTDTTELVDVDVCEVVTLDDVVDAR